MILLACRKCLSMKQPTDDPDFLNEPVFQHGVYECQSTKFANNRYSTVTSFCHTPRMLQCYSHKTDESRKRLRPTQILARTRPNHLAFSQESRIEPSPLCPTRGVHKFPRGPSFSDLDSLGRESPIAALNLLRPGGHPRTSCTRAGVVYP